MIQKTEVYTISRTLYCSYRRSPRCPIPNRRTRPNFVSRWSSLFVQARSLQSWPKNLAATSPVFLSWVRLADEAIGVAPTQSGALSAAERQELIELRRKLRQVQMERDILAKACDHGLPTAATRRLPRLCADYSKSGQTTCAHHVQSPQGIKQRLLRLAGPAFCANASRLMPF